MCKEGKKLLVMSDFKIDVIKVIFEGTFLIMVINYVSMFTFIFLFRIQKFFKNYILVFCSFENNGCERTFNP